MAKYRLRLKNGRVIGPFEMPQLQELKKKGHLQGDEEAQLFPAGDWMPMEQFEFYHELMDDDKTEIEKPEQPKQNEATFFISLDQLKAKESQTSSIIIPDDLPEDNLPSLVEEITDTVVMKSEDETTLEVAPVQDEDLGLVLDNHEDLNVGLTLEDIEESEEKEALEEDDGKTKINPLAQKEIEKMRLKAIEAEKKKEELEAEKKRLDEERKKEQFARDNIQNEATQVLKIDRIKKNDLLDEARQEELKVEEALKEKKKQEKIKRKQEEAEEEEDEEEEPKSKKKLLFIIGGLLLAYVFLFPEEDKKQQVVFKPIEPFIEFPIPYDKADNNKSKVAYNKGMEKYLKQTYPNLVEAAKDFRVAFENNIENMDSLGMMTRSYAELLPSSSEQKVDIQTLFSLISSKRPYLQDNPNGILGMALFYYNNGKKVAAANLIDTYIRLKLVLSKTNAEMLSKGQYAITQDLFAIQMKILVDLGRMDQAKDLYSKLEADKTSKKSIPVYLSMMHFDLLNEQSESAEKKIDEALEFYPKSVPLLLEKANFHARKNNYIKVDELLEVANQLQLENNIIYRARYFELKGMSLAFSGKVEEASKYLKESLKIKDSDDLRIRLSSLTTSDKLNKDVNNLILESKSMAMLSKAKIQFDNKNYELALTQGIRAVDIYPDYIPAQLFTARLQIRMGLTNEAIKALEALVAKFPESKDINLALIETYSDTYKFNDARNRIQIISGTDIKGTPEFFKAYAKLYIKQNDNLQAIGWLRQAINANPLDDEVVFMLAEILLKTHKYDQATSLVNKAIELDPSNPTYRIAYAKIIHETQDATSAIGYLLSLDTEFPDNPEILSEVAILYYRNGQIKDFEEIKSRMEKLPGKDKTLYSFLIKAALLDEKYNDIPALAEKILEIEPGDLEAMMTAARVLFETGKLIDATKWFLRLQEKLPSYPKLRFYLARIRLLNKEHDKAIEILKEDLKENGETDDALALLGQIYFDKGELVEAENYFKRTQKINARSYDALMGMAELSFRRNNLDQALDLFRKAQQQKSDDPTIHKKIGDVYRQMGQGALAVEAYKLYLELSPEAPDKPQIDTYLRMMQ